MPARIPRIPKITSGSVLLKSGRSAFKRNKSKSSLYFLMKSSGPEAYLKFRPKADGRTIKNVMLALMRTKIARKSRMTNL